MNILFCNIALDGRSGTEMFLWDLTRRLKQRGHGVGIFSPRPGTMSEALQKEGIPVWTTTQEIDWKPDVLHCQHSLETWRFLAAFPTIPAIYVCHDAKIWFDAPPPTSLISKYIAVDDYCRERVVRETGCETDTVEVIHNGVDLETFRRKEKIAARPEQALLFVSGSADLRYIDSVRAACRQLALPLDEVGVAVGKKVDDPENLLGHYDIVFAKARCAIEAMACGCAVVLVGAEGLGPMVTPDKFDVMRSRNFGRSLLRSSFDEQLLVKEIMRYDCKSVTEVSDLVRSKCGVEMMVDAFERVYAQTMRATSPAPSREAALLHYGKTLFEGMDAERVRAEKAHLAASVPQPVPPPEPDLGRSVNHFTWPEVLKATRKKASAGMKNSLKQARQRLGGKSAP